MLVTSFTMDEGPRDRSRGPSSIIVTPNVCYFFATAFALGFGLGLAVRDAVDLAGAFGFVVAARVVDARVFVPDFAATFDRAAPRTTSSCPGWMTCFLRRLSRTMALTDVPYFFAIPPSVSPRRTTCVREPERELLP